MGKQVMVIKVKGQKIFCMGHVPGLTGKVKFCLLVFVCLFMFLKDVGGKIKNIV